MNEDGATRHEKDRMDGGDDYIPLDTVSIVIGRHLSLPPLIVNPKPSSDPGSVVNSIRIFVFPYRRYCSNQDMFSAL